MQDGGATKTTSRFTRLLIYDVGNILKTPKLIGEYVVPLPQVCSSPLVKSLNKLICYLSESVK